MFATQDPKEPRFLGADCFLRPRFLGGGVSGSGLASKLCRSNAMNAVVSQFECRSDVQPIQLAFFTQTTGFLIQTVATWRLSNVATVLRKLVFQRFNALTLRLNNRNYSGG